MTGVHHPISVWFLCKSCGFTFHFQHVDKFLEHKKQVHFSEFEKIRCIVFEEKLDDNQEHYPDKTPEITVDSNLFHVNKVDLSKGEVECFWESETKPSGSSSTNDIISQDSPHKSGSLQDPQVLSSCVLPEQLASPESQLTQRKEIEEQPKPTTECLNKASLLATPTIVLLPNDNNKLPGDITSPSQEPNAVNWNPLGISDPSSRSFIESNPNRIVSFSTDPTEENILVVEITETQNASSSSSPNDSNFQLQLSACGSGSNALKDFADSYIPSDQGPLTDVLDPSLQTVSNLEPSLVNKHSTVIDEFENPAAIDVTQEIYTDFETVVYSDKIFKPVVASSALKTSNANWVTDKSWTNTKYNPYVLIKRLQLTDFPIGPKKDEPSEHSDSDNDDDYQPYSPQDTNGSDGDFDDDEPRTRNQRHKRNSSDPIPIRQVRGAFVFPSPQSDSEDANDPLTLKDWLLHQMETTDSNASTNIILLDPDPTIENVGPFTSENPITCKLCSTKLTSEPELKVHVKHCWLLNKNRHRFCVVCAKSYNRPDGLKRHNKITHGTEERKIFKCQYCSEQFEDETSWNVHEDTHQEKLKILTPFECKFCNKLFCSKSDLGNHLVAHSNDRPFKCDHPNCPYAAKRPRELKNHKTSHENPHFKPHKVNFKFPYLQIPEANSKSNDLPLADWIAKQTEEVEGTPTNVILLEPDPTKEIVGPITNENYISCKLCCEKLTSEARVKIHATHCWFQNKARHRYCILCNKKLNSVNSLIGHCVRIHGTEEEKAKCRRFKCHQCPKTYWQSSELRMHVETHKSKDEQNRPFVCETCGSRFIQQYALQEHMRTHSNDRPFKCRHPNCSQAFKTATSRNTHMQTHSDSRPHECPYPGCSKSFKTSFKLKTHYQVHTGKRYECTHGNCNKKFANSGKLERHIKARHTAGGLEKKFECDICHKKFASKCTLTQHAPIHLNLKDKPFKCSHKGCKEAFNVKRILDEHERKHTGELPFVCHSCGKAYAKEWSFKKHMRVHENAHNKHVCHICPRKFPGTWELKQHLLIHEKGKQFKCSECGKTCMTKANLNLHEKTHSKGKGHKGRRKNAKKVETSSESEGQNDSSSESEATSTEASTQSDEES